MTTEPSNPFASPGLPEVEKHDFPNVPSRRVLVIGVLLGVLVNGATSLSFYFDDDYSMAIRLLWVIVDLAYGVTYGLGFALLGHALGHRQFTTLAPGHWRLIAFLAHLSPSMLGYTGHWLNAGCLVGLSLMTRESWIWKLHVWWCVGIMLLDIVAKDISDVVRINFSSPELTSDYFGFPAKHLPILGQFTNYLIYALNTVSVLWILVAVAIDRANRIERDRYHFLGLILVACVPTVHLALIYVLPQ